MFQSVTLQQVRVMPARRPRLAQEITVAPNQEAKTPAVATVPVATEAKPPFIDSALVAFGVDVVAAMSTGMLAYGANKVNSRLDIVWGLLCGGLVFKGLADLARVRER
jgi:hypothetical protein